MAVSSANCVAAYRRSHTDIRNARNAAVPNPAAKFSNTAAPEITARPGGIAAASEYPRLESSCTSPIVQSARKSPIRVASRPPSAAPASVAIRRPVVSAAI